MSAPLRMGTRDPGGPPERGRGWAYRWRMAIQQPTRDEVVAATADTQATMPIQSVPVNVYETTGAIVIVAPLPAVTAEDVSIELRPGVLRFWASLRSAGPREYLCHEWEYGGFEREIDLPDGYGSGVEASLANGQLAIRVLRGEAASATVKPNVR
jgi:HSP20 family molecular chaperone IbpA